MPTTEILVVPLAAGSNIGDAENDAAKVLKEVGDQLHATEGVQQIQFGTWVESPDHLQLLVTWDSIVSHQKFMATEAYTPFLQRFQSIVGGAHRMVHVDLEPAADFVKAISAPVTEVGTFYFDGEAPANWLEGLEKFRSVMLKENSDGLLGACAGTTYESDNEREGVKGKAAVLLIGWESVEKHMAFRETATFKDNVHLLRAGVQKAEVHHVKFLSFVAGQ